jgi:dolichyl-diphosphooligosaccharide--protein glycosyltransferase
MLVLAPVMCILSGIAVSGLLSSFMKNLDILGPRGTRKKKTDMTYPLKNEVAGFMVILITLFLVTYTFHCTWVSFKVA